MFLGAGAVGIGDDCAVVPFGGENLLLTIDGMTEGRHFDLRYFDPFSLGWKLLAVNLSDVAAMGGKPLAATISLQLRQGLSAEWCVELYRGIEALAQRFNVSIVGGDTTFGTELVLTLALTGSCKKTPILRSGARPDQDIWLSGTVGNSGAGLKLLQNGEPVNLQDEIFRAHLQPEPRIELGQALLQEELASALIDVSDGLLQDLGHVARASRMDLVIDAAALPKGEAVTREVLSAAASMTSGEDYELAFCAPVAKRETISNLKIGCKLTRIGVTRAQSAETANVFVESSAGCLEAAEYLKREGLSGKQGFQHF